MYNKLILKNNGASFKMMFAGEEHTIPVGLFEAEATLGNFILYVSKKWGISVTKESQPIAPKVEAIVLKEIAPVEEDILEEVEKEEVKEDIKENKKKK